MKKLRQRLLAHDDQGMTLIELLIAMGLFSIVLAVIAAAMGVMTDDLRKTTNYGDAQAQARRVFDKLDKQVRYAAAINRPALSGTTWSVQFLTNNTGAAVCSEYRLVSASSQLQYRTWPAATTAPSTWSTLATGIVNAPSTQPPFTFVAATVQPGTSVLPSAQPSAGQTSINQGLTVDFFSRAGKGKSQSTSESRSSFYARNTTASTGTNADTDGNGLSDSPVCQ